ncbi:MAG: hypothetical protein LBK50_01725 [Candidatus Nomurabacteria bacterium]|jgi:hypothetical protein|nr:hypothetical protein [Candidatus Nomurabacteria bacterium]
MMNNLAVRIIVGIVMELILALADAPVYLQIFPVALLAWTAVDMMMNVKIVKIETQIKIPKKMRKDIEKLAKKQASDLLKDIEKPPKPEDK